MDVTRIIRFRTVEQGPTGFPTIEAGDDEEFAQAGVIDYAEEPGRLIAWVATVEVQRKEPAVGGMAALLDAPGDCKGGHILIGACGCQAFVTKAPDEAPEPPAPMPKPKVGFRYEDEPDNRDAICTIDFTEAPMEDKDKVPMDDPVWRGWFTKHLAAISKETGIDVGGLYGTYTAERGLAGLLAVVADLLIVRGYDVWNGDERFRVYAPAPPGYHDDPAYHLRGRSQ